MRYVSLFSGIEAATVAWRPLGWEAVAFAEIDPFCRSLLEQRIPTVPNLGDVSRIDWRGYEGSVDVVIGGSPCQAFSVAGRRKGMDDERGRLMLEFVRAVREVGPEWLLWENVPGVRSQGRGRAFGTLIGELEELGYGMAWRSLDAQFLGLAQRRERVFLVGHSRTERAAAVLFESESLRGNTQASREKRKRLTTRPGRCFALAGNTIGRAPKNGGNTGYSDDVCYTLTSTDVHGVVFDTTQVTSMPPFVVSQYGEEVAGTLTARHDSSPCADRGQNIVSDGYVVRRLTPLECERLMGFPDGWTDIVHRGKRAADSPRYKALGNSMAVPVMRWLGERIAMVDKLCGHSRLPSEKPCQQTDNETREIDYEKPAYIGVDMAQGSDHAAQAGMNN